MWRSCLLFLLVALQILGALTAFASVTSGTDTQHSALHAALPSHNHDDLTEHEYDSLDVPAAKVGAGLAHDNTTTKCEKDHHHHPNANLSEAFLTEHTKPSMTALPVQNPRVLSKMYSAEQRADLRPPKA
jgi:hypothetical protein